MKSLLHCLVLSSVFLAGCSNSESPETEANAPADAANPDQQGAAAPADQPQLQGSTAPTADGTPVETPQPVAAVTSEPSGPAHTLRHTFKKGNTRRLLNTIALKQSVAGQNIDVDIQNFNQWYVNDVLPDGSGRLTYSVDRVIFKMKGPGGRFNYDSDDGEEPDSPGWAQVKPEADFNLGCTFSCTISPRGVASDIHVPDQVVTLMKNNPGTATGEPAQFLNAMVGMYFIEFPETDQQLGGTWNSSVTTPLFGGALTQTTHFTLKPIQDASDTTTLWASGAVSSTAKFPEGSTMKVTIKPDARQDVTFAVATGHLVQKTSTMTRVMQIDNAGTLLNVEGTIRFTIVPDSRPATAPDAEAAPAGKTPASDAKSE